MKDRYFSHDCNALNDNKITDLRGIYGMEGYGVYWAILEAMSREEDCTLELTQRRISGMRITLQTSFDVNDFIKDCVDIGLFESDGERLWSNSMKRRAAEIDKRTKAAQTAAKARWQSGKQAQDKPTEGEQSVYDPAWKRVMEAYQTQIGTLPMGKAGQELVSYVDDMGADAVIVAIERTNEAQPEKPYPYLRKILEAMIAKDVHNGEQAKAVCNDYDRKKNNALGRTATKQEPTNDDEVRWIG